MATAKKTSKKTPAAVEVTEEQLKIDPEAPGEDLTDKYIADEYPWLETSQNIPQLLRALLREVVKGRMR
jgi:hypothetical protein